MTTYRNIVYFEADADEDDDGKAIVYLEAVKRGGDFARIELTPDGAEELAERLMEAVRIARKEVA